MNSLMTLKFKYKKPTWSEKVFFLAYGIYLIAEVLSTSYYYKYYTGTPHKTMIVIVLILLICKELYENKLTKQAIFNCAVCVGLFFLTNNVGTVSFAVMFVLIWSARNIEFERIAEFTLITSGILVTFVIFSSYVGIIENTLNTGGGRVRHYLGFRYALYGPGFLYNITSLYIYVRKRRIKITELFILGAINYLVYEQTNSRLSFGLTFMLLLVAIVLKYFPQILEKRRLICQGLVFSFPICAAVSLGITVAYNSSTPWMASLNTFLGSRLSLGKNAILDWGYTILGQKISWHGWGLNVNGEVSQLSLKNYNFVDCAYLSSLLQYGVIVFAVFLVVLTKSTLRCYRRKNYYLLILLTFIAIHSMIDNLIVSLSYNTLWFVVAARIEGYVGNEQEIRRGVISH